MMEFLQKTDNSNNISTGKTMLVREIHDPSEDDKKWRIWYNLWVVFAR